ncbi:hypothetical protein [Hymenobacter sp. BT559]|jgi:NTE family protein|uniref:hypothetical protein n=1 Tax=Hymenobacter sp. BT559 TaxID=2795729 RepID=UPI0018EE2845|nr:hypothetical protein [Hymenobacter sp. BT559]MBJ6145786.1 hypothetical protein [Hymenobacter sp. BT559]
MLSSLVLLGTSQAAQAQATSSPITCRNLIMKGDGIRGIAYGGALQELAKHGVQAFFSRVQAQH